MIGCTLFPLSAVKTSATFLPLLFSPPKADADGVVFGCDGTCG